MEPVYPAPSPKDLQIQGHRGARASMPENTIPAFDFAIKARAHTLELDILMTLDHECVIHHDFFINKDLSAYLDGSLIENPLLIKDLTLAEIRKIDVGSRSNPTFPKQAFLPKTPIPTLVELFEWIKTSTHPAAKTIQLNIEIKRDPRSPEWTATPKEIADKIIQLVDEHKFSNRVYYSSFDPDVLLAIRNKNPKAELGLIFDETSLQLANPLDPKKGLDLLLQLASSLKAKVLSPDHMLLGNLIPIDSLQNKGFHIIPWTVNDTQRWEELLNMNVTGIITDDPESLVLWLETKKI